LWLELDTLRLLEIGIGAMLGAALLLALRRGGRDTSTLAFVLAVCAGMGAAVVIAVRFPHSPIWPVLGFLSAAAPATMTVDGIAPVKTLGQARRTTGRVGAMLAGRMVAGVAAALVGFLVALFLLQATTAI
jgi:sorbitol-specific phosphotransferase system component IIBC